MATATKTKTAVRVGKRELMISNIDKVLYPQTGFTKGDIIHFYHEIAPVLLPHLKNRPLTLKRYPNGVEGEFFYEKMCPKFKPEWMKTHTIHSDSGGRDVSYCVITDAASLLWVANLASIEMHTMLSRITNTDKPTMLVLDHDPGPGTDIIQCGRIALRLREILDELGLECFAKTSGGKGLHVCVPLNTAVNFDQTKEFALALAQHLERELPDQVTSNMRKDLREGRVFIDWSQNDDHKTTVSVYSLRARAHPTVSTPVTWDEVEAAVKKKKADRLCFETDDVLKRVEKDGDLMAPLLTMKQKLPKL